MLPNLRIWNTLIPSRPVLPYNIDKSDDKEDEEEDIIRKYIVRFRLNGFISGLE
jgi:hypothetical protein